MQVGLVTDQHGLNDSGRLSEPLLDERSHRIHAHIVLWGQPTWRFE